MSFAPRPINSPHTQSHRFGSNPAASSRFRGQVRANSNNANSNNSNFSNSDYGNSAGNNRLVNHVVNNVINNAGKSNVTDFTARRQQQVSSTQTPQLTSFPRTPLNFSPASKTSPDSPTPNFVTPNPWWMRSLSFLKYGSGLLTGGLIFVAITVYGGNVSTQRQWSESYRQLESLRRTERQLVVANEVIKNKAAQESSTTKQLVRLDPAQRLYLPAPNPAPEPSPKNIANDLSRGNAAPKTEPANKNSPNQPLGY
jgi:hypothetical protein